jgi:hypothetical protein
MGSTGMDEGNDRTSRTRARHAARAAGVAAIAALLALAGCTTTVDGAKDRGAGGATTGVPGSTAGSSVPRGTAPPKGHPCADADERNQDDDGAFEALLSRSELPGGGWSVAPAVPCPWALSADDLLAMASCREAALAAGASASPERRNGNGRITYQRSDGVQLDDRVEIYTSAQNVDAIRAILPSAAMPTCVADAVTASAARSPSLAVTGITVSRVDPPADEAALALGYPAVEGYAADTGFVDAVDVSFTVTSGGTATPVALRMVAFGAGGLMSIVTVIGHTATAIATFDLDATLRAAAKDFRAMINGPTP